jgi:hypothetical protein
LELYKLSHLQAPLPVGDRYIQDDAPNLSSGLREPVASHLPETNDADTMGQGFSLATPSIGSAGIDIPELSDLVYEKSVGSARFMKSIRARHHDGVVLVKILVKPYVPMPLEKYKRDVIS